MEPVLDKLNAFAKSGQDFFDGLFRRRNPVFAISLFLASWGLCEFFSLFLLLVNFRLKSLNGCREKRSLIS